MSPKEGPMVAKCWGLSCVIQQAPTLLAQRLQLRMTVSHQAKGLRRCRILTQWAL